MTISNSYDKIRASGPGRKMQNLRPEKAKTQLQLAVSGPHPRSYYESGKLRIFQLAYFLTSS